MSHSHDSTLIQRMGFSDPDRRLPAHDAACIAMAVDPHAMVNTLGVVVVSAKCEIEKPLQKGDGKYATTVGFIDGLISIETEHPSTTCKASHYEREFKRCDKCVDTVYRTGNSILVEVKTVIVSIGDLLRQMNLYREYSKDQWTHKPHLHHVVWSLGKGDAAFGSVLASQGYRLVVGADLQHLEVVA